MQHAKILVFLGVFAAAITLMSQTGQTSWYEVSAKLVDQDEKPLISKRGQVYGVFISIVYPDESVPGRVRVHWTDNGGYSFERIEIRPTVVIEEAYVYDGFAYRPLQILDVKRIGDLSYEVVVATEE